MLGATQIQAAADFLFETWIAGKHLDSLPPDLRPTTRAEGYAIQACVESRGAKPLFGWKIAATSVAGQKHIGVNGPMAGRLLEERTLSAGEVVSLASNLMRVAEAEFAFRMGKDLAPRDIEYTVDEVLAAVDSLHPAIEIPDSRYADFATIGEPHLIADNSCAHLFLLGEPAAANWRDIDLSTHVVQAQVVGKFDREGVGRNVLGDPRIALTWLANELSRLELTLKSGQVVTTGTCSVPLEINPGDHVVASYGTLGSISLKFS